MMNCNAEKSIFCRFEQIQSTIPIELEQPKDNKTKMKYYTISLALDNDQAYLNPHFCRCHQFAVDYDRDYQPPDYDDNS